MPLFLIQLFNFVKSSLAVILKYWEYALIIVLILMLLHYNTKMKNMQTEHIKVVAQKDVVILKLKSDISKAEKEYIEKINLLNKQSAITVEKLQEKHEDEIKAIETNNVKLSSAVSSLQQTLKRNGSGVHNSTKGGTTDKHSTTTESLLKSTSESFGECVQEYSEMAETSDKLQSSVTTLQESWGKVRNTYNNTEQQK